MPFQPFRRGQCELGGRGPTLAGRYAGGRCIARERSRSPGSPANVNEQAIMAVIAEVGRRGGRARVERLGNKKEIIASGDRGAVEVVRVVHARTREDWQTSTTYGEPRAPEEHPTRFWVLVDLYPEATNFYIVPERWMVNNIHENHQAYLDPHGGSRAVNDDSIHHRIEAERVSQWAGRWDQLRVLSQA